MGRLLGILLASLFCLGEPCVPGAIKVVNGEMFVCIDPDNRWYTRQPETKGLSSWYGQKFKGRRTAYGEVFDPDALTCASRYYRYGTILLVRYPKSGTSVIVRVNDKGPFVRGRILDLSERAATVLGIKNLGIAWVEIMPEEAQ